MYIKVKVRPGVRKEYITKVSETELHIAVREPAKQNLANKRVRAILAEMYGIGLVQVQLVTGHRSISKIFDIITR